MGVITGINVFDNFINFFNNTKTDNFTMLPTELITKILAEIAKSDPSSAVSFSFVSKRFNLCSKNPPILQQFIRSQQMIDQLQENKWKRLGINGIPKFMRDASETILKTICYTKCLTGYDSLTNIQNAKMLFLIDKVIQELRASQPKLQ